MYTSIYNECSLYLACNMTLYRISTVHWEKKRKRNFLYVIIFFFANWDFLSRLYEKVHNLRGILWKNLRTKQATDDLLKESYISLVMYTLIWISMNLSWQPRSLVMYTLFSFITSTFIMENVISYRVSDSVPMLFWIRWKNENERKRWMRENYVWEDCMSEHFWKILSGIGSSC